MTKTTLPSMKFVRLDDDLMPALGLGTYRLDGAECARAVASALELGYRHIDTAERYGNEAEIGEVLQSTEVPRDELWITSKVWLDNLTGDGVRPAVEGSLERLGLDRLDLLLVHWPPREAPLREVMLAMNAVQAAGLTRHIGVSNFTPSLLRRANELSPVCCNQVEYHPFLSQRRLARLTWQLGMVLTAYSPLARGEVNGDRTLRHLAKLHQATPAQVALAWLLAQNNVVAIPKAASREHQQENIDALRLRLSPDELLQVEGLRRGERHIDPDFAPTWRQ